MQWFQVLRSPNVTIRLGLALAAGMLALVLQQLSPLAAIEWTVFDLRSRWAAQYHAPSDKIMVLALDNRTLGEMEPAVGRWPWPRAVFAGVINFCSSADVIAMDILFPEADWQYPGSDDLFVAEVSDFGRIISAVFGEGKVSQEHVNESGYFVGGSVTAGLQLNTFRRILLPYRQLRNASFGLGHVNYDADDDGVLRRHTMFEVISGEVYPSLAVSATLAYRNTPPHPARTAFREGISAIMENVAVDDRGQFLLNPSSEHHQTVSMIDILNAWKAEQGGFAPSIPRERFDGKIILVGSLATGLQADRKVTSMASDTAGVYASATAIDNMLSGNSYRLLSPAWCIFATFVLALLPALPNGRRPILLLFLKIACVLLYFFATLFIMAYASLVLPIMGPGLGVLLSSVSLGAFYWHREYKHRKHLEKLEQAKQRFTDMLVHDMRGRVSGILMSMSLLERTGEKGVSPDQDILSTTRMTADRLLMDIRSLLDIRKMQEGRLALQKTNLELVPFLGERRIEFETPALCSSVEIRLETEKCSGAYLYADPKILARILGNLLWNAIDHARIKTVVTLGCARNEHGGIDLYVTNSGKPVPEEVQANLFTPFVSYAAGKRAKNVSGTGLGLAFCKLAAEAHGASIRMISPFTPEGDGVKVAVRFPSTSRG